MWKFALAAFLPAYFAGWAIVEPGQYRGSEGLGAGLAFISIGLFAFFIAKRIESQRPAIWGAAALAGSIGLALLGQSQ